MRGAGWSRGLSPFWRMLVRWVERWAGLWGRRGPTCLSKMAVGEAWPWAAGRTVYGASARVLYFQRGGSFACFLTYASSLPFFICMWWSDAQNLPFSSNLRYKNSLDLRIHHVSKQCFLNWFFFFNSFYCWLNLAFIFPLPFSLMHLSYDAPMFLYDWFGFTYGR